MARGFYRVYLESRGFKTPVVTYALSEHDAAKKALDYNADELPAATVFEVQGPFSSMVAMEMG
ncbi:MAG: hypothetical protein EPN97_11215 [Alphaproteobacteria bacterium]|nr:MAG: hypothetical protein EPN97_11215 [Alphaproteobacteria bacterium]